MNSSPRNKRIAVKILGKNYGSISEGREGLRMRSKGAVQRNERPKSQHRGRRNFQQPIIAEHNRANFCTAPFLREYVNEICWEGSKVFIRFLLCSLEFILPVAYIMDLWQKTPSITPLVGIRWSGSNRIVRFAILILILRLYWDNHRSVYFAWSFS